MTTIVACYEQQKPYSSTLRQVCDRYSLSSEFVELLGFYFKIESLL
jgi:hypothetical protein